MGGIVTKTIVISRTLIQILVAAAVQLQPKTGFMSLELFNQVHIPGPTAGMTGARHIYTSQFLGTDLYSDLLRKCILKAILTLNFVQL